MEIRIRFDSTDPPSGHVLGDGMDVSFAGWLELLALLSTLGGSQAPVRPA